MEFSKGYPEVSAFGIKDILNELAKKRKSRAEEMEQQFPMKNIRGLNAMGGVPVDMKQLIEGQGPNEENPLGMPKGTSAGGVEYQGRDIYQSIHRLQNQQMKDLYSLTPKSYIAGTVMTGGGRGGKAPRSRGGSRSYGGGAKGTVRSVASRYGWDKGAQWKSLKKLVSHESSFRSNAQNPTSTAYGLFQFLNSTWAGTGVKKTGDPRKQSKAGLIYIKKRYGSPKKAWEFWKRNHWY